MKRVLVSVLSAALLASVLVGCSAASFTEAVFSPRGAHFINGSTSTSENISSVDGPQYTSLKELATASTLVVQGTFVRAVEKSDDGTLSGSKEPLGLPLVVWTFKVDSVFQGDQTLAGQEIRVAQYDFERIRSEDLSNVASSGAKAVVFLLGYSDGKTYGVAGTGQGALLLAEGGGVLGAPNATEALIAEIALLGGQGDIAGRLG